MHEGGRPGGARELVSQSVRDLSVPVSVTLDLRQGLCNSLFFCVCVCVCVCVCLCVCVFERACTI